MYKPYNNTEITAAAHAAHEANRAYCALLGDYSHPAWDDLSIEGKTTALESAIGILAHDHNEEQSHNAWLTKKRADGWMYGAVKDVDAKLHPCLIEYAALPPEQQIKNKVFVGVVKLMASAFWRVPA
jgi:hypothetical protein